MCSLGKTVERCLTTVKPPIPESKTPIGFSLSVVFKIIPITFYLLFESTRSSQTPDRK